MKPKSKITFDFQSRRRRDDNGYMHVSQTPITKEQVVPYLGHEIPGWEELGIEAEKIYYGYRPAEELEKSSATLNGVPLLLGHEEDSADKPLKDRRVGSVGTSPVWNPPYLENALSITDSNAIDDVEAKRAKEISAGYYFDPDFTPGEFNGVPYDFVMRNIRFNHVALVKEGRAGPDVSVHDALPSKLKAQIMKLTHKQVAMRAALSTYLRPRLTADALPEDLVEIIKEKVEPEAIAQAAKEKYEPEVNKDSDIDVEELVEVVKAAEEATGEDDPAFDDGDMLEGIIKLLDGNVPDEVLEKVKDALTPVTFDENDPKGCILRMLDDSVPDDIITAIEDTLTPEAKEEVKKTMTGDRKPNVPVKRQVTLDAATIERKATEKAQSHFRALYSAASRVKPLVGELDAMAFDSAEGIFKHALKQRGYKIEQYPDAALQGMVDVLINQEQTTIKKPTFDAAPEQLDGPFANLSHIKLG